MKTPVRNLLLDSVKVILPTLIAFAIFAVAVFGYFLPAFEQTLLVRKREALRELTSVAWFVLDAYHAREVAGELDRREAQGQAAEVLRHIRYGTDNNEYFWVNDLDYTMIMHPYRRDLEGQNLADFADQQGTRVFREFGAAVAADGEGFATYQWQWHADETRQGAKLSHLRVFAPWRWMVGTGVYLEDVDREAAEMSRRVNLGAGVVLFLLLGLALYIIRSGVVVARARTRAEQRLIRHQKELESTVTERTAALRATNASLQREIGERRQLAARLEALSSSDELTGLLNRRGFVETAAHRLAEAERREETLFLAYVDLDNMKAINDSLGHNIGDEALIVFADLLRHCFRTSDIIGRLGGDEFVILLAGDAEYGDEQRVVSRLQQRLDAFNAEDHPFRLEASTGVARYRPGRGASLDDLLSESDRAMYLHKQHRKQAGP